MGVGREANNKPVTPLGLLAPEYEGSLILVNIRNYAHSNTSHSRRPESSKHYCENLKTRKTTPHLNKHVMQGFGQIRTQPSDRGFLWSLVYLTFMFHKTWETCV